MANVVIQKIKSAISALKSEQPSASTDNVISYKIEINSKQAMEALNEIESKLESVAKKAGSYDDGYGAPDKGNNPSSDPTLTGNPTDHGHSKAVPGVPGTMEAPMKDKKEGYDDKYVAPKAEDKQDDHQEPDGDECTCSKCGSKYKMKKSETDKPSAEKAPATAAYDDKYVAPKAEKKDDKMEFSSLGPEFVCGQRLPLAKPTVEELTAIKGQSFKAEQSKIFGKSAKAMTPNAQMTQWAMEQFMPKTVTTEKK